MSISVGELFVNLGVKGSEKTVGAINTTKKGMGELASTSIEAKAAIVGAMYALERLFAASGAAGTGLTNFNSLLGVSAKTLQQYQYAARQMGVNNQEVEGSFKSLQGAMTKTLMGEGAPKGMGRVAQLTGGITVEDIDRFAKQPQLLIQKLQEYASKEKNVGLRNEVLKSFGVGDNMISAMSRGAFSQGALRKAPTYSNSEIGALDRANIAWSNLGTKIEMAVGHFNAKHGGQLVKDISLMVDSLVKLAGVLQTVSEKFKLFELVSHGIEGVANSFKLISEVFDKFNGKDSKPGGLLYQKPGQEMIPGLKDSPVGKFFQDLMGSLAGDANGRNVSAGQRTFPNPAIPHDMITPRMPAVNAPSSTQNVEINQTLHFQHDGKDHKKTSDSTKKAVQDAYRQISAQGQGS